MVASTKRGLKTGTSLGRMKDAITSITGMGNHVGVRARKKLLQFLLESKSVPSCIDTGWTMTLGDGDYGLVQPPKSRSKVKIQSQDPKNNLTSPRLRH